MQIAQTFASKAAVAVVATAMIFSAIAAPAKAQTMTQEQLLKMISDLQAQLAKLSGSTTPATSAAGVCPFTWTRDLKTGANGADVQTLQKFLNANADTRVSAAGAGSTGMETMTFGPATAAAVSKFQVMYRADILTPAGLTNPTGFFGPSTRAKANALCAAAVVVPTPTPTPTSTTPTPTPTPGIGSGEGSIERNTSISAEDSTIREGATTGLFAWEDKISGDVSVDRVDVYMDSDDTTTGSSRASNFFQGAVLRVDGKTVKTLNASDFTEDTYNVNVTTATKLAGTYTGKEYRLRFTGLGLVFKDGQIPQFEVALEANNTIDTNDQTTARSSLILDMPQT